MRINYYYRALFLKLQLDVDREQITFFEKCQAHFDVKV